jgi:phage terminase small subunit
MPAKKPISLSKRHSTKEEIEQREAAEAATTPTTQISTEPPAVLKKHQVARETWSRLVQLYLEAQGTLITAFDADLLAKYCILEQECQWLEGKRAEVDRNAVKLDKQLAKMNPKGEQLKVYAQLLEQYNALNTRVQGLDARLDGKRKLLHSLAQSLYLTPRSRAGVTPPEKTKPKPDRMSAFD